MKLQDRGYNLLSISEAYATGTSKGPQSLRHVNSVRDSIYTAGKLLSIAERAWGLYGEDNARLPPHLQPCGLARIVDARLDKVMPSRWTSVPANDSFLKMLMKLYFQNEHSFFSFFYKDLFLDDMLSESSTFCLELLVNAVLAMACVSPL